MRFPLAFTLFYSIFTYKTFWTFLFVYERKRKKLTNKFSGVGWGPKKFRIIWID